MEALFSIVKNEMIKHKVKDYHLSPVLIEVAVSDEEILTANNDFYFFANAFTDSGIANGYIRGGAGGNALNITPKIIQTVLYKHQMFKGKIAIKNISTTAILYVELLRATPVFERKEEK